jgi:hypothetical protein
VSCANYNTFAAIASTLLYGSFDIEDHYASVKEYRAMLLINIQDQTRYPDSTPVVLQTIHPVEKNKFEFRIGHVKHSDFKEGLRLKEDATRLNPKVVRRCFDSSSVYLTRKSAVEAAQNTLLEDANSCIKVIQVLSIFPTSF